MKHFNCRRAARALTVVALAAGLLAPCGAAGAEPPPDKKPLEPLPGKHRPPRWWLDVYAHSMQERAFIEWMNRTSGGTLWQRTMRDERVNALWDWWCAHVWNPAHGTGDAPR
jgi:hypothetical protein